MLEAWSWCPARHLDSIRKYSASSDHDGFLLLLLRCLAPASQKLSGWLSLRLSLRLSLDGSGEITWMPAKRNLRRHMSHG